MKKVLLASTALVFTAGYAAAEVAVTGGAVGGLKYNEGATEETRLYYELDFNVVASGTSDAGLEFGASFDMDLDSDGDKTAALGDAEIFISGTFGTITIGEVDSVSDNGLGLGFADPGFDGIGVDDDAETFIGAGSNNVNYTYAVNGLQFQAGASLADDTDPSSDDWGIGAAYSFGNFEVQAAYEQVNGTVLGDADIIYLGFEGSAGMISYDLFYHQAHGDLGDAAGYGASLEYVTGATTFVVAAGDTDLTGDDADYGVGASYDLGGGLALAGGIGSVNGDMAADLGLTMSF